MNKIQLGTLYMNGVEVRFNQDTPTQFIVGQPLELRISSSNTNNVIEWIQFADGARHFLLSTRNILTNISYNDLYIQALVDGRTMVTLNGIKYKIRLLTSIEYDKYIDNDIGLTDLLTPTIQDKTEGSYTDTTISSSDSNNIWHWWKLLSLTQTVSNNTVATRGGTTINGNSLIDLNNKSTNIGWRILLEKYNYPPVISGTDGSLGSFTSSIIEEYTVTDADLDLFKVEEILDGSVYRTLENQSSETKFTFSLSGTPWNTLSAGQHELIIKVTDIAMNSVQRRYIFNKIIDTTTGTSPNLTRPVIITPNNKLSLNPINALVDNQVDFKVVGGELFYYNEINIVNNTNSSITVFNRKIESFDYNSIIPKDSLINGNTYQIKIRTYNSNNLYSAWSDSVLVKCLTPPDLMITSVIDGKIQNSNPIIAGTYYQKESDSLYSYEFNLYKDGVLVQTSGVLLDGLLQYQFTNLDNKTNYTIELKVETSSGMQNSISLNFYCMYLQTKLPAVMKLINDAKTGSVQIKTYVRQILGRIYSGDDINYIDGEWADLHNTVVIFDNLSSFRLEGDWTAKIWARDLENNDVMLVKFELDDNNYIQLSRYNNMFSLTKFVSGIKLYELHSFVVGDILATDVLYFYIQNDTNLGLMNFDVKRVTDGRSTWFTKSYNNDVMPSYASENGFLSYIHEDFRNILMDNNIDGDSIKVYIPTLNELNSANADAILGTAIIGDMVLGNSTEIKLGADIPYFTRTIDTLDNNKLIVFNTDETTSTFYPNVNNIGIRFAVRIPNATKISTLADSKDNCYNMTFKILSLFDVQNISNLNIGDKVKANCVKYKNKIIKFTIYKKDTNSVYLLSDIISINKEFDSAENVYTNGNPSWNLSNIKQWLNSDIRIG